MTFMLSNKARLQWAGLLVPAIAALCANAAPPTAPGASVDAAARARVVEYSVINLGPDTGQAFLNARDQVAFATWTSPDNIYNGFFDGRRVHTLAFAGRVVYLRAGLEQPGRRGGPVAGCLLDYRAFTWTAARGMRALPGPSLSDAHAINNLNQVVGAVRAEGQMFYTRANRWDADGTLTRLGPPPARLSAARAINDSGVSVGDSEVQFQDSHAMVWDRAGTATDLGLFGGTQSTATHVNASGQVLGTAYKEFAASASCGAVRPAWCGSARTRATSMSPRSTTTAKSRGTTWSQTTIPGVITSPFIWSAARGMRSLPAGRRTLRQGRGPEQPARDGRLRRAHAPWTRSAGAPSTGTMSPIRST
jgi:hypothetical protein